MWASLIFFHLKSSALAVKEMSPNGFSDQQWKLLHRFANAFGLSLGEIGLDKLPISFKQLEVLLLEPEFRKQAAAVGRELWKISEKENITLANLVDRTSGEDVNTVIKKLIFGKIGEG